MRVQPFKPLGNRVKARKIKPNKKATSGAAIARIVKLSNPKPYES
jgi:hypothetical protein